MDDLVAFLRARLDEDEATAFAADGSLGKMDGDWSYQPDGPTGGKILARGYYDLIPDVVAGVGEHVVRHDPDRVLREVKAKRAVVDRYAWLREHGDTGDAAWVLPLLALPYADHPDYRPEWAPST